MNSIKSKKLFLSAFALFVLTGVFLAFVLVLMRKDFFTPVRPVSFTVVSKTQFGDISYIEDKPFIKTLNTLDSPPINIEINDYDVADKKYVFFIEELSGKYKYNASYNQDSVIIDIAISPEGFTQENINSILSKIIFAVLLQRSDYFNKLNGQILANDHLKAIDYVINSGDKRDYKFLLMR